MKIVLNLGKNSELEEIDGKIKNGVLRDYYKNGNLRLAIPYKDFKKNGTEIEFYNDYYSSNIEKRMRNRLSRLTTYTDDEIDGLSLLINEDGGIFSQGYYKNGLMHGTFLYCDGHEEIEYRDGLKNGISIIWFKGYKKQKKEEEAIFVNGKRCGKVKRWNFNGIKIESKMYIDDVKHGKTKFFNEAGVLDRELFYEFGKLLPNSIAEILRIK